MTFSRNSTTSNCTRLLCFVFLIHGILMIVDTLVYRRIYMPVLNPSPEDNTPAERALQSTKWRKQAVELAVLRHVMRITNRGQDSQLRHVLGSQGG
ncbi:hypothetical protein M404DRAFT_1003709 [Pisolithus tinctorius Marx 270]|uniref:Uncharacterized protein n=1 Tax=Pisolithus tinctorius Marx 270 TaxID=870435 RepID=A0A0C3NI53_PISTI|nr:hypothetical protein M404DRAFT_1003709 [Pisolithus tinctorius Marx 270]